MLNLDSQKPENHKSAGPASLTLEPVSANSGPLFQGPQS